MFHHVLEEPLADLRCRPDRVELCLERIELFFASERNHVADVRREVRLVVGDRIEERGSRAEEPLRALSTNLAQSIEHPAPPLRLCHQWIREPTHEQSKLTIIREVRHLLDGRERRQRMLSLLLDEVVEELGIERVRFRYPKNAF
ncbi:MAG TPA: hypothetical protein VM925_14100 [Labilithrix sp.]|nr:hypothetical protein [Labilithrix sp.]